jgi:hypothetical protein
MSSRSPIVPPKYKVIPLLVLLLALFAWNGYSTMRHFAAEVHCNTVTNSTLNRDQNPALEEIKEALSWNGHNAKYWHKLASALWSLRKGGEGASGDEEGYKRQVEIVIALEEAIRRNPFDPQYHALLAWEYSYLWQAPDYHEKWLTAADQSMDRAAYFAGDRAPRLHVTIGNYWIMRSKTVLPSDPLWETAWTNARRHYRKALAGAKGLNDEVERFVWKFYPDKSMVQDLMGSPMPEG